MFVKPSHLALEKEMDEFDAEIVRKMAPKAWFEFKKEDRIHELERDLPEEVLLRLLNAA
jgi:hypothetical protein